MIPEELLERFRTLSLERIGRVEAMWNGLVQNIDADESARQIARDVHTLKGDAAIVGDAEVANDPGPRRPGKDREGELGLAQPNLSGT